MIATPRDFQEYWIDAIQRSILTLDVYRERGNEFIAHFKAGKPPVLTFEYDAVLDGANLPRPCNYVLLRIRPPAGAAVDPARRAFIVVDPRAGHGPGIGGMKEASQVGVAMQAGHPVYLVSFRPEPVPGQTLHDVAAAERAFVAKVTELHPEAEAAPAVVGNCQAGWAIMAMLAAAPEAASVVAIAGAPLSYWAGVEGRNPLRYFGGLMGGNWAAGLVSDLGDGIFDGANLVVNFENLNPANALLEKPYGLYSRVDTEAPRFLEFERWWGGYFLMTKAEILEITSELFIGNKLTRGEIVANDGTPIDLRAIRAPIVVICSEGDNITPPPQALNWVLDLYQDVDEIRANEQTIVYTVHPSIGHLGIFVSTKVASKEHKEFVDSLELIESLPPGLYEMVVVEVECPEVGADRYVARFEARGFDDLRSYDDGRGDEEPFRIVAQMSEAGEGLYETFLSPAVRAMTNPGLAQAMRWSHPKRLAHLWLSDMNPWLAGLKATADYVRRNRRAAGPDNALRAAEAQTVEAATRAMQAATVERDRMIEASFKALFGNPTVKALGGQAASFADIRKPATNQRRAWREVAGLKLAVIAAREHQGTFQEAVLRVIYAAVKATGVVDARAFAAARTVAAQSPRFADISRAELRQLQKEAALMVALDEDLALETLPKLLPTPEERREAVALLRRLTEWRPEVAPEVLALLSRVEEILGLAPGAAPRSLPAPDPSELVATFAPPAVEAAAQDVAALADDAEALSEIASALPEAEKPLAPEAVKVAEPKEITEPKAAAPAEAETAGKAAMPEPEAEKPVAPEAEKSVAPKAEKSVAPKAEKSVAPARARTRRAAPRRRTKADA